MNTENMLLSYHAHKFSGQIMNIAYSFLAIAPMNTAEHYHLAAHMGFNTVKGDVRITADDGLVMCHDEGVTLDGDGRIVKYDPQNCIKFVDGSYDYFMGLEYVALADTMGHYAKVCNFDTYLRICKETGKVAFITLRDEKIQALVRQVMAVVKKYRMENHCVFNSFTLETLREARKYTDTIPLSYIVPLGVPLDRSWVDTALELKNAGITLFHHHRSVEPWALWEQSADGLGYAEEKGVPIYMAQVDNYPDYAALIRQGVQGVQITRAFLPYDRADVLISVAVENGQATMYTKRSTRLVADLAKVGGTVTISNIRCNGSGYGYDDGLPKLWLNRLPYSVSVMCAANEACYVRVKDGTLILETGDVDGIYHINVNI